MSEMKLRWWPADYLDELMPEGRATPGDWIECVIDGKAQISYGFDVGEEEGEPAPKWLVGSGEVVAFCYYEERDRIMLKIEPDGSYAVTAGRVLPDTNCFGDTGSDDNSVSLEDFVARYIDEHHPESSVQLELETGMWSVAIPHRVMIADGVARCYEVEAADGTPEVPADQMPLEQRAIPNGTIQFRVDAEALRTALENIALIVERMNMIPILGHVLITAAPEGVTIAGTDLDSELTLVVPAKVTVEGAVTAPLHRLLDIAKSLQGEMQFDAPGDGVLRILCDGASWTMRPLPVEDMPQQRLPDNPVQCSLDPVALRLAIVNVEQAISTEEARFYLNGIHLHAIDGGVRVVATDGHRLAWRDLPVDGGYDLPSMIVPKRAVHALKRCLGAGRVTLCAGGEELVKAMFMWGGGSLLTKCIDAAYPNYRAFIDVIKPVTILTVDARALRQAIQRACASSRDKSRAIIVNILATGMSLSLASYDDDGGFEQTVPAQVEGPALKLGLCARYLDQMSQSMAEGELRLEFMDAGSPVRISHIGEENERGFVLMPMRIA